jgi:heparan-alpha-glucosaminide N-acetyltransferase
MRLRAGLILRTHMPPEDIPRPRLASLDVFRGLTMVLLIPDVFGGFSFYEMARRFPNNAIWAFLARLFTHAQWTGVTVWDLIMPAFVFMIGMSMPFSQAARVAAGDTRTSILAHAALRAIALLELGILFLLPADGLLASLWPLLLLLSLGLPIAPAIARRIGAQTTQVRDRVEWVVWGGVLAACAIHIARNLQRAPNFYLHDILPQVALGYFFAFLLVGRRLRTQWFALGAILLGYWLAFALYPIQPHDLVPSTVGVMPGDEVFHGFFAHWNKNTNVATAFDVWFLNLLPRPEVFRFNSHGYQTLSFIPTLASMIFGVMSGEYVRSNRSRREIRNGLTIGGSLAIALALVAGWTVCPIVKSIWTPSFALVSTGCVVLAFAALYAVIDVQGKTRYIFPLVVVGRNPLFLYVLAIRFRWWVLAPWRHTVGVQLADVPWQPVLEALACLVTLWLLGWLLYRRRIYIRL